MTQQEVNNVARLEPGVLRVLVVEDSVEDTFFIVRELQRGGFQVAFERVETAVAMQTALQEKCWDLIISDYRMPQFSGEGALAVYLQSHLEMPFIVVSGMAGEETAVDMLKAGAHNYLKKENLARLVPAVRQELELARQRRLVREREENEAYLASLVDSCEDAIIGVSLEGVIRSWNAGAERLLGFGPAERVGHLVSTLSPPERAYEWPELLQKVRTGQWVEQFETVRQRKDGKWLEVSLTLSPVRNPAGQLIGISVVERDISARKQEQTEHLNLIQDLTSALAQATAPPQSSSA